MSVRHSPTCPIKVPKEDLVEAQDKIKPIERPPPKGEPKPILKTSRPSSRSSSVDRGDAKGGQTLDLNKVNEKLVQDGRRFSMSDAEEEKSGNVCFKN